MIRMSSSGAIDGASRNAILRAGSIGSAKAGWRRSSSEPSRSTILSSVSWMASNVLVLRSSERRASSSSDRKSSASAETAAESGFRTGERADRALGSLPCGLQDGIAVACKRALEVADARLDVLEFGQRAPRLRKMPRQCGHLRFQIADNVGIDAYRLRAGAFEPRRDVFQPRFKMRDGRIRYLGLSAAFQPVCQFLEAGVDGVHDAGALGCGCRAALVDAACQFLQTRVDHVHDSALSMAGVELRSSSRPASSSSRRSRSRNTA